MRDGKRRRDALYGKGLIVFDNLVNCLRNCATNAAPCNTCNLIEDDSCSDTLMKQAADAIEELQRICDAMRPKHDAVCVKCAYYAEAEYNDKGFLICPASGMDITAWDFCSYFEPLPDTPKEEE